MGFGCCLCDPDVNVGDSYRFWAVLSYVFGGAGAIFGLVLGGIAAMILTTSCSWGDMTRLNFLIWGAIIGCTYGCYSAFYNGTRYDAPRYDRSTVCLASCSTEYVLLSYRALPEETPGCVGTLLGLEHGHNCHGYLMLPVKGAKGLVNTLLAGPDGVEGIAAETEHQEDYPDYKENPMNAVHGQHHKAHHHEPRGAPSEEHHLHHAPMGAPPGKTGYHETHHHHAPMGPPPASMKGFSTGSLAIASDSPVSSCTESRTASTSSSCVGTAAVAASSTEKGLSTSVADGLIFTKIQDNFLQTDASLPTVVDVTVNDGAVLLTGKVKTPEEKVLATKLTWEVRGVREVVNEKLTTEAIHEAARHAKQGGLTGLKLYGMVGLPTESDDDVEATADLLLALKKGTPGLRFTLGVSTFVPKAQTPFQWQGVRPEAEKRLKRLAKRLKPKGIEFRPESYGWSVIQALLSRSDRRLAPVIAAVGEGRESMGGWKKTYRAALNGELEPMPGPALPPPPPWSAVIHEPWEASTTLPWTHLRGPLAPTLLRDHHDQALAVESVPPPG